MFLLAFLAAVRSAKVVYVDSASGSDANSGTSDAPVLTIEQALTLTKRKSYSTIKLRGTFYQEETVNIEWGAWEGLTMESWDENSQAILSGATMLDISNWKQTMPNIWETKVDSTVGAALAAKGHGHIYVNEVQRQIARTDLFVFDKKKSEALSDNTKAFVWESDKGFPDKSWSTSKTDVANWRVVVFHSWTQAINTVSSIDTDSNTLHFNEVSNYGYGSEYYCSQGRWYIENIPEMDLTKGSWKYNANTQILTYSPAAGEMFPAPVAVPTLDVVLAVTSTDKVTLKNLLVQNAWSGDCGSTKSACDKGNAAFAASAVYVSNSKNVTVTGLTIRKAGGVCFQGHKADGLAVNKIATLDCGARGIVANGAWALVNDSIVNGYGQRFPSADGLTMDASPYGKVTYNEVTNGLFAGLSAAAHADSGPYCELAFNHVHHIGSEDPHYGVCDFGGYHGSTVGSTKPFFITSNKFHDITAFANGGAGIYLDVSSTGYQVSRNLVYNVSAVGLISNLQTGTVPNLNAETTRVFNNVFVLNRDNSYQEGKGAGNNAVFSWKSITTAEITHNVAYIDSSNAPSRGGLFNGNSCYQTLGNKTSPCSTDYAGNFRNDTIGANLWYSKGGPSKYATFPGGCNKNCKSTIATCSCKSFDEWQSNGNGVSSLWQVDPKFDSDYLVTSKQALDIGISPLTEMSTVGPSWKLSATNLK